ncbi:hypothetical protein BDM02DRAFT_3129985 [Thelephora ganbajun]|uniref:Uncharacterized protein n=1 Tax=Thelephora ganbajun TaxID=370292 RepID=A0ACB6ZBY6_THEGA|nr:hypothetical protein BDM02DRAFT_3129985 [Thelephora ganbajun]
MNNNCSSIPGTLPASPILANTPKNEDEDFSDLGLNDFILSQKVTTRHKLECLQGNVFNKALLERGTFHAMEGIEEYNRIMEALVGYTSCVGVMLAEELALTNDSVGAISMSTCAMEEKIAVLLENLESLTMAYRRLKHSHESLKIHVELELANQDLMIGLLWAWLNSVAPMEVNLTGKEEEEVITPPLSGNMSTMDVSTVVCQESEDTELEWDQGEALAVAPVPVGILVPIEDEEEVVKAPIEVPKLVGIILPRGTFNWQDEAAQGQELYYHQQREEEDRACLKPEFVPPPDYEELFPDVIRADQERYMVRYSDGRSTSEMGPEAGPLNVPRDD